MLSSYFHHLAFPTVQQAIQHPSYSSQDSYWLQQSMVDDPSLSDMMQVLLNTTSSTTIPESCTITSPLSSSSLSVLQHELSSKLAGQTQQETISPQQSAAVTPATTFVQLSANSTTATTTVDSSVLDEQEQNEYQLEDLAIIRLRPAKKKYGIANLTWNGFEIPELHSGTYRYILQIDMSKHCANIVATQEKFAFALLVENGKEEQTNNSEEEGCWQKVNDKYGGNGLKEMSFAQFVNGLPNVLEFSLKFSVNSHEFKKKPFKFQVYFMGALIFESHPFKLVAHKDKRNDIFNKDTYGKKNVAKRAYTKKQSSSPQPAEKKSKTQGKKQARQVEESANLDAKKRRMSKSGSSSPQDSQATSSEDEVEDVASPTLSTISTASAKSASNFALTIPMQFILNNPILRQACEQHAGSNNNTVVLM